MNGSIPFFPLDSVGLAGANPSGQTLVAEDGGDFAEQLAAALVGSSAAVATPVEQPEARSLDGPIDGQGQAGSVAGNSGLLIGDGASVNAPSAASTDHAVIGGQAPAMGEAASAHQKVSGPAAAPSPILPTPVNTDVALNAVEQLASGSQALTGSPGQKLDDARLVPPGLTGLTADWSRDAADRADVGVDPATRQKLDQPLLETGSRPTLSVDAPIARALHAATMPYDYSASTSEVTSLLIGLDGEVAAQPVRPSEPGTLVAGQDRSVSSPASPGTFLSVGQAGPQSASPSSGWLQASSGDAFASSAVTSGSDQAGSSITQQGAPPQTSAGFAVSAPDNTASTFNPEAEITTNRGPITERQATNGISPLGASAAAPDATSQQIALAARGVDAPAADAFQAPGQETTHHERLQPVLPIDPLTSDGDRVGTLGGIGMSRSAAGAGHAPASDQVALQIARSFSNGMDRLTVHLQPAELGRVDVQLSFENSGRLSALITAERAETLELLQRDSRLLERSFGDAGLKLTGDGLSFALKQDQQHQHHGQQFHDQAQARQNAALAGRAYDDASESESLPPTPTVDRLRLLDIHT